MPRTKTCVPSTGSVSSVRYASRCTPTPSRSRDLSTRSSICQSRWTMTTTIFCSSPCLSTRTRQGTFTYSLWPQSNLSSSSEEAMRVKWGSMTSVSVGVTPSSSANRMVSTSKITPQNSEQLFCWRINWDWKPSTPWQCKLVAQW